MSNGALTSGRPSSYVGSTMLPSQTRTAAPAALAAPAARAGVCIGIGVARSACMAATAATPVASITTTPKSRCERAVMVNMSDDIDDIRLARCGRAHEQQHEKRGAERHGAGDDENRAERETIGDNADQERGEDGPEA